MSDDEPVFDYTIKPGTFPAEMLQEDRWFVWAMDQDRKIPRAPWANQSHIDKYVSWKDQDVWTDFETASDWVEKLDRFGHAWCIPAYESNDVKRLVLFDFDDCRDPETGAIHPEAWAFIDKYNLHAALSTSGTGLHGFAWTSIPEDFKPSFTRKLTSWEFDDVPELEVYGSARFIAVTGQHIEGTPISVPELSQTAHDMFHQYGEERVTGTQREPDISRGDIEEMEGTTDVEDIYDAIALTKPRDIRLRSTVTEERADGTKSLDPSWEQSESGTRLAQFDDHWLYRKGDHHLDALQVVALEERIISNPSEYPSGDDFVDAVEALRQRGAQIPELVKNQKPALDVTAENDTSAVEGANNTTAETDGGTAAESPAGPDQDPDQRFEDDVREAIILADEEDIQQKTARHRIANAFIRYYDFVYPEEEVHGWRDRLYVFNSEEGIYEPRGEAFVEKRLEEAAGDYITNQVRNEIVGKIERMSTARGDMFRTDPNRLVVGNGVLDLHTGELDHYSPHEYHRTKIDVDWNPDAGGPDIIDDFLHDIVRDDDVQTLYRVIAHGLYKEYVTEKAAMLIGSGQNGKSVFLDLVEHFLGGENITHRSLQDFEDKFAANQLEGKLANVHPDMGDAAVRDMSMFKKLTGRDTMLADVKYEAPIKFENFATLMFAANEMPVFREDNHAVWRRWLYIDFPYTFNEDDPEAKEPVPKRVLMQQLTQEEELEALLVRCQKEIQQWYGGRDWFPDAMDPEEVREQMKRAAEPVFDFAATCLQVDESEEGYLLKDEVREAYRQYANQEDLPTVPKNQFGEQLVNLNDYPIEDARRRVDGQRRRVYTNISWSSQGRQILGFDEPDEDSPQSTMDDLDQKSRRIAEIVAELVEANESDPVGRGMILGRASSEMGLVSAENALKEAKKRGHVMQASDDKYIDT